MECNQRLFVIQRTLETMSYSIKALSTYYKLGFHCYCCEVMKKYKNLGVALQRILSILQEVQYSHQKKFTEPRRTATISLRIYLKDKSMSWYNGIFKIYINYVCVCILYCYPAKYL